MCSLHIDWKELDKKGVSKQIHTDEIGVPKSLITHKPCFRRSVFDEKKDRIDVLRSLERDIFRLEMKIIVNLMKQNSDTLHHYGYYRGIKIPVKFKEGVESCFQDNSRKPVLKLTASVE